jgi:predicted N-acetyltransferase YhbS
MITESHTIRQARPDEAGFLSDLALRSKAHWGYSQEFLESCRSELSVDSDRIGSDDYQCFVAVKGNVVIGFYTLENVSGDVYELGALFVEPEHIGTGVGRSLVQHAIGSLSERSAERLIIQGDPNSSHFYVAAGARQTGSRESGSIPGRYLPLFEIEIRSS